MSRRWRNGRKRRMGDGADARAARDEMEDRAGWAAEAGIVGRSEMSAQCDRCGRLATPYTWVEDVRGRVRWHLVNTPDEPDRWSRCGRIAWIPPAVDD